MLGGQALHQVWLAALRTCGTTLLVAISSTSLCSAAELYMLSPYIAKS